MDIVILITSERFLQLLNCDLILSLEIVRFSVNLSKPPDMLTGDDCLSYYLFIRDVSEWIVVQYIMFEILSYYH